MENEIALTGFCFSGLYDQENRAREMEKRLLSLKMEGGGVEKVFRGRKKVGPIIYRYPRNRHV